MGYRLIDTAEMYGDGGAEEIVGAALHDEMRAGSVSREELTIVSKVLPSNASHAGVLRACERSLKRLKLDVIDIYLLHWRGSAPLADTIAAFEQLRQRRPHPSLGCEQLRHGRHAAALEACRRIALRHQSDVLLGKRARAGVRPAAMATRPSGGDDGVLADRSRRAGARRDVRRDRPATWHQRLGCRACLGPSATGHHRDSDVVQRHPSARKLRRCRRSN